MKKQLINTPDAPQPIGPYSQAIITGDLIFISGQIAIDPTGEKEIMTGIKEEAKQVMENLKSILSSAGVDFSHVVKTTIYLTDMNHFAIVNEIYGSYFTSDFPARETVEVARLPKDYNVEISMIAQL
ncbi:MAG: RidA family protein [Chitinophagales bacterium]|nr:RidA family protein [Chitinophagales bacterium]